MKSSAIIISVLACAVAIVAGGFIWAQSRPVVVTTLAHEAGQPLPNPSLFLIKKKIEARYSEPSLSIDTGVIGDHPIEIITAKNTYASVLSITDSVSPQALTKDRAGFCSVELEPEDFVTDIIDATSTDMRFFNVPNFDLPGKQTVKIALRDSGGNETIVEAGLTLYALKKVSAEAGADRWKLKPTDFIDGDTISHELSFGTNLTTVNFHKVGKRAIKLKLDGSAADAELNIFDTTPPTADTVEFDGWLGDMPEPMDFVKNVKDKTAVTAKFGAAPDFSEAGEQDIEIILSDEGGNLLELATTMTLKADTEAPIISGDTDKYVFIGDSIAYRADVSVTDNRDEKVPLSIDSSEVDVHNQGTYKVYYSAVDSSGNESSVTGTVTVFEVTEAQVYEMADAVLARIIDDSMSLEQKARKIYDWVRGNVRYVSSGEKDNVMFGAYRAMQKHSGDCYTFYAISELLLTRVDVPNMGVTRVGGRTRHYWQIIDVGTGWYHFDTTPYSTLRNTFMFTESQAEAYTNQTPGRSYYVYDKTLYPEVVQ